MEQSCSLTLIEVYFLKESGLFQTMEFFLVRQSEEQLFLVYILEILTKLVVLKDFGGDICKEIFTDMAKINLAECQKMSFSKIHISLVGRN